ncbi:MAG: thioredoxin-disulfide reductase [bacterium]|nr:thioredoxin-disulfide reductase [bacterium]
MFDTIIIGAGPTGLTAAIYASRRMMKTLVISKNTGGQIIWTSDIENYPGIKSTKGPALANIMLEQAKSFGVEVKIEEVNRITKQGDGSFSVKTNRGKYEAKTMIIAMGLAPRLLNLPNEKALIGQGISYCANCDGLFFKGKTVAVIGGGNAALDAATVMSKIASQVYLIYRNSKFKGFEIMANRVKEKKNIEILMNSEITEILGKDKLEKLTILNKIDQTSKELKVDGLFVEIGHEPETELVADLVERDSKGQVVVDLSGKTSLDGIFAAGDVTQSEFKQIVIGCGQGAVAALSAYKYLQNKK